VKLDNYDCFTTNVPDDVRWERVERIRQILAGGTYAVPAIRVAAKLLRHMLELDRVDRRWEQSESKSEVKSDGKI
jgi:hypothetical protein